MVSRTEISASFICAASHEDWELHSVTGYRTNHLHFTSATFTKDSLFAGEKKNPLHVENEGLSPCPYEP
jgi:hypothetical protein